jgi:hypothetical protein
VGEELGIGLLIRCLGEVGFTNAQALGVPCTPGTKKGKRLDTWVGTEKSGQRILFQVEVKSWCAHSLGGCAIPVSASAAELETLVQRNWARYWDSNAHQPRNKGLQKVLAPMQVPAPGADLVEPIACVWDALHPSGELTPWFSVEVSSSSFSRLWWFSMSSYLRTELTSGLESLTLDMPRLDERLERMGAMFGPQGDQP